MLTLRVHCKNASALWNFYSSPKTSLYCNFRDDDLMANTELSTHWDPQLGNIWQFWIIIYGQHRAESIRGFHLFHARNFPNEKTKHCRLSIPSEYFSVIYFEI